MTGRSAVSVAALACVLALGVAPGTAQAAPSNGGTKKALDNCEDQKSKSGQGDDCTYE